MIRVDAKTNIRNRFDIECKDIRTGEVQKFQAHNIVLDQMWSRLVNFQTYFSYIRFGTGTGALNPARTSLFNDSGGKSATSVSRLRALPTSRWMRQIVINPEEYVGHELTEVGVAYGSGSTDLVTHAFLEDSEGNPISIVKTDTMVVTIYATIFIELGELTDMYGGQWRWVMPPSSNQLINYLTGYASYPTQRFRVTRARGFAPEFHEGVAPTSHGRSSDILVADWSKDAANKRVTTPVRRLGISDGNGEIRGFGLGSSDVLGTFRGQFPIPGVFTGHIIEGEPVDVGDGETTGFNLQWNDPQNLTLYIDGVPVDSEDYDLLSAKKGTNLFLLRQPVRLSGPDFDSSLLTDGTADSSATPDGPFEIGIDVGEQNANVKINKFRVYYGPNYGNRQVELRGSNKSDFSDSVLITETVGTAGSQWHETTFDPVAYRYYRINKKLNQAKRGIMEIEIIAAEDQITFDTAPADGAIITADYTVAYVPKDVNHVLDLQVTIQYGEGS